jgi:hypothetical protein
MSRKVRKPFIGDFEDCIGLLHSLKARNQELDSNNFRNLENGMKYDFKILLQKLQDMELRLYEYLNNVKD